MGIDTSSGELTFGAEFSKSNRISLKIGINLQIFC